MKQDPDIQNGALKVYVGWDRQLSRHLQSVVKKLLPALREARQRVLLARGATFDRPENATIDGKCTREIKSSDFCVFLVHQKGDHEDAAWQTGVARALGKPMVVFYAGHRAICPPRFLWMLDMLHVPVQEFFGDLSAANVLTFARRNMN